jgi:hypothetical protein
MIDWVSQPPTLSNKVVYTQLHRQQELLQLEIQEMLQKDAIQEVKSQGPGFCSNILPGPKERLRQNETSDKPQGSQQVCKMSYTQDTFGSINNQNDSQRDLAGVNRSQRCIFSCSNASQQSQVSEICFPAEDLSIQSAPLRVVNSTKGFHKGSSPGSGLLTSEQGSPFSLPR